MGFARPRLTVSRCATAAGSDNLDVRDLAAGIAIDGRCVRTFALADGTRRVTSSGRPLAARCGLTDDPCQCSAAVTWRVHRFRRHPASPLTSGRPDPAVARVARSQPIPRQRTRPRAPRSRNQCGRARTSPHPATAALANPRQNCRSGRSRRSDRAAQNDGSGIRRQAGEFVVLGRFCVELWSQDDHNPAQNRDSLGSRPGSCCQRPKSGRDPAGPNGQISGP